MYDTLHFAEWKELYCRMEKRETPREISDLIQKASNLREVALNKI